MGASASKAPSGHQTGRNRVVSYPIPHDAGFDHDAFIAPRPAPPSPVTRSDSPALPGPSSRAQCDKDFEKPKRSWWSFRLSSSSSSTLSYVRPSSPRPRGRNTPPLVGPWDLRYMPIPSYQAPWNNSPAVGPNRPHAPSTPSTSSTPFTPSAPSAPLIPSTPYAPHAPRSPYAPYGPSQSFQDLQTTTSDHHSTVQSLRSEPLPVLPELSGLGYHHSTKVQAVHPRRHNNRREHAGQSKVPAERILSSLPPPPASPLPPNPDQVSQREYYEKALVNIIEVRKLQYRLRALLNRTSSSKSLQFQYFFQALEAFLEAMSDDFYCHHWALSHLDFFRTARASLVNLKLTISNLTSSWSRLEQQDRMSTQGSQRPLHQLVRGTNHLQGNEKSCQLQAESEMASARRLFDQVCELVACISLLHWHFHLLMPRPKKESGEGAM